MFPRHIRNVRYCNLIFLNEAQNVTIKNTDRKPFNGGNIFHNQANF